MEKPELLWVVWQNNETRHRYHIGNLIHVSGEYYFQYEHDKQHRGLKEAIENGYKPHLAFPDIKKLYISKTLFGPFARRLPNQSRPDYKLLLNKYGLNVNCSKMDILRATGGLLATDSYELVNPVYIGDDSFELDFYVAGWRYHDGESIINDLTSDTKLSFLKEEDNLYDKCAVMIKTKFDNKLLGYVPAFYSDFMTYVLSNENRYDAKISRVDKDAIPQLKVKIELRGTFVKSNNFNSEELIRELPVQYMF